MTQQISEVAERIKLKLPRLGGRSAKMECALCLRNRGHRHPNNNIRTLHRARRRQTRAGARDSFTFVRSGSLESCWPVAGMSGSRTTVASRSCGPQPPSAGNNISSADPTVLKRSRAYRAGREHGDLDSPTDIQVFAVVGSVELRQPRHQRLPHLQRTSHPPSSSAAEHCLETAVMLPS